MQTAELRMGLVAPRFHDTETHQPNAEKLRRRGNLARRTGMNPTLPIDRPPGSRHRSGCMVIRAVESARRRARRRLPSHIAFVTLLALAVFACRSGTRKKVEKTPYALDLEQICNAEERSGALEQDPSMRSVQVASWLANNLVTDESRALLGELAAMAPDQKAKALAAEAEKHAIAPCPMAAVWSGQ